MYRRGRPGQGWATGRWPGMQSAREAALMERIARDRTVDVCAACASPEAIHRHVQRTIAVRPERRESWASSIGEICHRGAGDCDDHVRVVCSLARGAGIAHRVVFFRRPRWHVVTQLRCPSTGRLWQWAETTAPRLLGEHPWGVGTRSEIGSVWTWEGP